MKKNIFFVAILFLMISNAMGQLSIQGFYMEYEKTIRLIINYKGYEDNIFIMENIGNNGWKAMDTIVSNEKSYIIQTPTMNGQYKCTTNSEESNIVHFTTAQICNCSMVEKRDLRTKLSEKSLYVQCEKKAHAGDLPKEAFLISMEQHIIKCILFNAKGEIIASYDNEKKLSEMMTEVNATESFEEKIQKVEKTHEFLQGLKKMEFTTEFLPNGNYMLEIYTDEGPFENQKKSSTFIIQR